MAVGLPVTLTVVVCKIVPAEFTNEMEILPAVPAVAEYGYTTTELMVSAVMTSN